jgi:hypothetical protein
MTVCEISLALATGKVYFCLALGENLNGVQIQVFEVLDHVFRNWSKVGRRHKLFFLFLLLGFSFSLPFCFFTFSLFSLLLRF